MPLRLGVAVAIGVALNCRPSFAAEPASPSAQFTGRWVLEYRASVREVPLGQTLKTSTGSTLSDYRMSYSAQTFLEVQKDGKLVIETANGQFRHIAESQAAEGTKADYHFYAAGTLNGTGEFTNGVLKLKLEWKPGEGTGTSSGKTITKSVITEPVTSEWELKPAEPWAKTIPEWRRKALTYSGQKTTKMPQKLFDCPPLPFIERLQVVKLPVADLEVSAKASPETGVQGGTCALSITVKNLGPDECPGGSLRVVLPPGTKVTLPKGIAKTPSLYHTLKIPIEKLPKDAVVTVKVEYEEAGEKKPAAADAYVAVMAHVSSVAYDPNQSNNGTFVTTIFKAKK